MYRQYEDPRALEEELKELEERLAYLRSTGQLEEYEEEDFCLSIHELKERINFAWQDEEYDENYC